ncbi:MAG: hypothetical protein JNM17_40555 [Archangium sp.]|nr:hypothetical protein [Archangium sp.]
MINTHLTIVSAQEDSQLSDICFNVREGTNTGNVRSSLIVSPMNDAFAMSAMAQLRCMRNTGGLRRADLVGHGVTAPQFGFGLRSLEPNRIVLGTDASGRFQGLELLALFRTCLPVDELEVRLLVCKGERFDKQFLGACLGTLRSFAPKARLFHAIGNIDAKDFKQAGFATASSLREVT